MKISATVVSVENEAERQILEKRAVLDVLERELLQRELELATFQGELAAFERRYVRMVGILQARLDELELRIADLLVQALPEHPQVRDFARQTRMNARESSQAAGTDDLPRYKREKKGGAGTEYPADEDYSDREHFQPSNDLKQTYRDIAKRIHPDLALDAEEHAMRTSLMIEANIAFQEGDAARLLAILRRWENSPHHWRGDDPSTRLERLSRRILQVEERLAVIERQMAELHASDIARIKQQADDTDAAGIDLLGAMAERLKEKIFDREMKYRDLQELLAEDEQNRPV